ncbi:nuclear transport factor 2 family protein [Phormidesmis sp. 146-33]
MENLSLLAALRELECELHQPECRRNRERLAQLLAPDFKEFGRSGATYTRDYELMSLPSDPEPPQIHAQDFAVNKLSDSIALLTYRDAYVNPSGELFRHTNRSSIWRLDSSGWQMVFHQGTPTDSFDQSAV